MSYFYPLQSTSRGFDNPLRKDADKQFITLSGDIHSFISYKDFTLTNSDSGVYIDFDNNSLCPSEEDILSQAINFHINYTPSIIEVIHNNWLTMYTDYKQARANLGYIVTVSGFDNLSTIEKQIATQWFVLPVEQRNQVYDFNQQLRYGIIYHESSMAARDYRLKAVALEVYNRLSKSQVMQIVSDMEDLPTMYVRFGKEGTLEGDGVGFFDFMLSRPGTPYETTGLSVRDYVPVGATMDEMINNCMNILKSGIYPI
jgi:hypothetical protein